MNSDLVYTAAQRVLAAHHRRMELAPRTKARAVADQELVGMFKMLDALNLVPTPTAAELDLADCLAATIAEFGTRPAFRPAGRNDELKFWDRMVAELLTSRWIG